MSNLVTTSISQTSLRPIFSATHLLQANHAGNITEIHRRNRGLIPTHPIDNIDAHVVADRDDGIFVETHVRDDGLHRVHITIADVASHVPLRSPLAKVAFARGFTVYGPGWTDSMFPKSLEEKLSLEHQQERLGFTISIDLDANFKPQRTEFLPVITHAESMSYAEAAERMDSDPQLQQMAKIAHGIRNHYFGHNGDAALLLDGFSGRDLYVSSSSGWRSATEMVATYMLLANRCTAEFFNQSGLPYIYRNFNGEQDNARARYDIHNEGHDALRRDMGLSGAYGHFTSPIRRAADLLNSYMAHFAFDALQSAEDALIDRFVDIKRAPLHKGLWDNGAEILKLYKNGVNDQYHSVAAEALITDLLVNKLDQENNVAQQAARDVVHMLQHLKLPLSPEELSQSVEHLNTLAHVPETRALAKKLEDYTRLGNLEKNTLLNMEKRAFSALLRRAASFGEIPRPLYNEALMRITKGLHDNVQDSFTLLILAPYPDIPRWNMLKRSVLRRIKHDPAAVNAIVEQSQTHFGENILSESSMNLSEYLDSDLPNCDKSNVSATILTLKQKGETSSVAAPFYSVGHNSRAAISHARYAFLEHYAFGELQPVEQISLPNVLYAELESGEKSRRALVEEMALQAGGKLKSQHYDLGQGVHFRLDLSGGKFTTPIVIEAEENTLEAAERTAFRRLLRDTRFKHAVAPLLQVGPIMNPQHVLQAVAEQKGYSLTFFPASSLQKDGFLAEIRLTSGEMTQAFRGKGPNKDRALRSATMTALKALGTQLGEDGSFSTDVRSWATENEDRTNNQGYLDFTAMSHPSRPRKNQHGSQSESILGKT